MKKKLLPAFKYLLFLLAGIAIIYYLFKAYYTPAFIQDLKSVSIFWVLISTIAVTIANIFRTLRWQLMITPLEYRKPKFIQVFNALMVGYLVNLALPRAGELARCAFLAKKEKMNTVSLIGSVIAERIFDLLMLILIVFISIFLYADIISSFLKPINFALILNNNLPLLILLSICFTLFIFLFLKLSKAKNPFFLKIIGLLMKLKDGLLSVKDIKQPKLFMLYTFLIWFFYLLATYLGFMMLKETSNLDFSTSILTLVAGSFGMIAPIQGGIGAYHFMVSQCLVLLGIGGTAALVYATILHASQTITVVVLGFLALMPKIGKKQ
ncbi:lysylphosphatidylglycerol synthase transmembrane domain-containing protein [Pedobacter alpinus]|uniref:Lysylphosphatidylglycerol synthase transmembrane domain-containing protein n=1 Tax=Pedobacter alpinus TaxID=1590643 RepID=A0ABW5TPI4_9SPHI